MQQQQKPNKHLKTDQEDRKKLIHVNPLCGDQLLYYVSAENEKWFVYKNGTTKVKGQTRGDGGEEQRTA